MVSGEIDSARFSLEDDAEPVYTGEWLEQAVEQAHEAGLRYQAQKEQNFQDDLAKLSPKDRADAEETQLWTKQQVAQEEEQRRQERLKIAKVWAEWLEKNGDSSKKI